jgi:hypothetical protein
MVRQLRDAGRGGSRPRALLHGRLASLHDAEGNPVQSWQPNGLTFYSRGDGAPQANVLICRWSRDSAEMSAVKSRASPVWTGRQLARDFSSLMRGGVGSVGSNPAERTVCRTGAIAEPGLTLRPMMIGRRERACSASVWARWSASCRATACRYVVAAAATAPCSARSRA